MTRRLSGVTYRAFFSLSGLTGSGNAEKLQISGCSAREGAKKGEETRDALWGL